MLENPSQSDDPAPRHDTAEPPDAAARAARSADELIGQQIDHYKLLSLIGEGGFGAVYLAEQREPVRRKVALKLIKLGMDTRQVVARFEAERQALAVMDHPNIARVFDAGATPSGRPYFVMELVRGVPITQYCDDERLTPQQRLRLFMCVCRAVQHAHQKGIIHRDLKPTNVLVTMHDGRPVPKVIDFGIAKATNAELTQRTLFTEARQFIGTPEYMSPEQAGLTNLDIDTRSDVYSLGVLLYELLTGLTPFDGQRLRSAALNEIQRIIRDEDPPKPSTRLSELLESASAAVNEPAAALNRRGVSRASAAAAQRWIQHIARHRRTEPRHLTRLLRGELDWIVMKALEKDRTRRYETACAFAEDLERYLSNQPVHAGPPSAAYRMRKFYGRNRSRVLAAAALALSLLLGLVGTSVGMSRALAARHQAEEAMELTRQALAQSEADRLEADAARAQADEATFEALRQAAHAREQAEIAEAVNNFLNRDILARVSPEELGREVTLRQVLDSAARQLDAHFAARPPIRATLEQTIGRAYLALGEYELSQPHLERAVDLRKRHLGENHRETLQAEANLASLYLHRGQFPDAFRQLTSLRERATATLGPEDAITIGAAANLGVLLIGVGDYDQADRLLRATRDSAERALGADHPYSISVVGTQGNLALALGQAHKALELFNEVLARQNRVLGENHVDTLLTWSNLANVHVRLGDPSTAERLYANVLQARQTLLGESHHDTLATQINLAMVRQDIGRHDEVLPLLSQAIQRCDRVLGPDHPTTLMAVSALGTSSAELGEEELALEMLHRALEGWTRAVGPAYVQTLKARSDLVDYLRKLGRAEEAMEIAAEHLALLRGLADRPDADAGLLNTLAMELVELAPEPLRDAAAALAYAQRACDLTEHGVYHYLDTLALATAATGNPQAAIEIQKRVLELLPPGDPNLAAVQEHMARFIEQAGGQAGQSP